MNHEIFQGPSKSINPPAESKLTIFAQNLYSEKRGSFMEGDQNKEESMISPKPASGGKSHTPQEKSQMAAFGEALKGLPLKPPKEFQEDVEGKLTPEEKENKAGIINQREAERLIKDVEVRGQLRVGAPPISEEGVTSEDLKHWISVFNESSRHFAYDDLLKERGKLIDMMFAVSGDEIKQVSDALGGLELHIREAELERRRLFGAERGHYGQHVLDRKEKEYITGKESEDEMRRERIFNRMFIRVDARPGDDFRDAFGMAGEIEYNDFITTLIDAWEETGSSEERERLDELITKYTKQKNLREILHQANYAFLANVNTETFTGFCQKFTSDMADTAYRTLGATVAAHLYEQVLRQVISENDGYLPVTEVAINPRAPKITGREGRVEELTQKYFDEALKLGLVKEKPDGKSYKELAEEKLKEKLSKGEQYKDESGNPLPQDKAFNRALDELFPEWRRRQALALGRSMGLVTMGTLEVLGAVKLPKKAQGMPSLYGQDVVRDLVPFRHFFGKYDIGIEKLAVFAFAIKGGKVWSQKELLDFKAKAEDPNWGTAAITNGDLLDELGERYINRITPFEFRSIYSGWQVGAATADLEADQKEWIGLGVRIEQLRGKANSKDKKEAQAAKGEIEEILIQMAEVAPLKLFRQMPEIGEANRQKKEALEKRDQMVKSAFEFDPAEPRELIRLRQNLKDPKLSPDKRKEIENRLQELIKKEKDWEEPQKRFEQAQKDLMFLEEKIVQEGFAGKVAFKGAKIDNYNNYLEIIPEENKRRENAKKLKEAIKGAFVNDKGEAKPLLQELAEKIGRNDWPFVLGTEDVPFDHYQFVETGPTGLARKQRDFAGESKAAAASAKLVNKMDSYRKPEQILEEFKEIYNGVASYDETKARRVIAETAEGVAKFYAKDWWARMPFGIGTGLGFLAAHGLMPGAIIGAKGRIKSSYAKTVFGNEAMAWNEKDKWDFTCALEAAAMLDYTQVEELRKRIGATRKHLAWYYVRTYTPSLGLGLLIEVWRKFTEGLGKDLSS